MWWNGIDVRCNYTSEPHLLFTNDVLHLLEQEGLDTEQVSTLGTEKQALSTLCAPRHLFLDNMVTILLVTPQVQL